jgi:hypothetical protein
MDTRTPQQKTYAQAMSEFESETSRILREARSKDRVETSSTVRAVYNKINQIEEKQRCMRVRLLDWLSDTFHNLGNKFHTMSVNIDSPCVIKLPADSPGREKSDRIVNAIVRNKK